MRRGNNQHENPHYCFISSFWPPRWRFWTKAPLYGATSHQLLSNSRSLAPQHGCTDGNSMGAPLVLRFGGIFWVLLCSSWCVQHSYEPKTKQHTTIKNANNRQEQKLVFDHEDDIFDDEDDIFEASHPHMFRSAEQFPRICPSRWFRYWNTGR